MNRRRMILAFVAVLVLASLGWLVSLSKTSQAAPSPSTDAAFKGKVLLVKSSQMSVFLLENAKVRKFSEHSWLTGKGVGDEQTGGWYKGRPVWVRMEQIVSITEFDEVKDAKKAMQAGGAWPFGGYGVPVPVEGAAVPAGSPAPAAPPPPAAPPK